MSEYIKSPSVQFGAGIGLLMYFSYACAYKSYSNLALIFLCAFICVFAPYYSKLSNRAEEKVNVYTAMVTLGRLARFGLQFVFNVFIFFVLEEGRVIPVDNLNQLGGVWIISFITTCASQGMQYVAIVFSNREIGDKNRNVLLALSINILVTALATLGLGWAKVIFQILGLGFGAIFFLIGAASDLRTVIYPSHGVGLFLGTFNPIHNTHLQIIRNAIEKRGLRKVYIHCTVIPKIHAQALERDEIRIAHREHGMRVYQTTPRSDVHVNYFPTGNRFYEYETRLQMMHAAIEESGLSEYVEVLSMPDEYTKGGFYEIIKHIKKLEKGSSIHGIHGSDLGGMWVRSIYDESGWIYPYPVVRRDKVSATAIRNGAKGLTTKSVQMMIYSLHQSNDVAIANKSD